MLEQGLKAWVMTCPAIRSEYVLSYSNREIPRRGLIIAFVVGYSRTQHVLLVTGRAFPQTRASRSSPS